jgi:chromosome segregation ATPase
VVRGTRNETGTGGGGGRERVARASKRDSDTTASVLEEISSHLNLSTKPSSISSATAPTSLHQLNKTSPLPRGAPVFATTAAAAPVPAAPGAVTGPFSSPPTSKLHSSPSSSSPQSNQQRQEIQQQKYLVVERSSAASTSSLAELERKLKEATLSTHQLRHEVSHLESSNQKFQQELMELRLKLIAKETQQAELEQRCEGLEAANEETWKKCVVLGRREEAIRIENEVLKKQSASLQAQVQVSLKAEEEVKRMKERLLGEVEFYLKELREREAREKTRGAEEERREIAREEELSMLRSEKRHLERFVKELETKLTQAKCAVEEAVCEKEVQGQRIVELQCGVAEMSEQLRNQKKEWERGEGELRELLEMKEQVMLEVRREKDRLQSELTKEMKRSANLGKEFDQEVLKRERLSVENERCEREMKKMREENEELRGEVVKHREVISFINRLSVGNVTTDELMRVGVTSSGAGGTGRVPGERN